MPTESWKGIFRSFLEPLRDHTLQLYGDRLISLVVFGSVGRGSMRPDSDIDVLIISDPLPHGRLRRVEEFGSVESEMDALFRRGTASGVNTRISPVFKTPQEAKRGSALFLDMVDDACVLFDRGGFFGERMLHLRERLNALGSKRIWKGNAWYWDLKPDYKWGDEFEL
jgi:uncharacterized protein